MWSKPLSCVQTLGLEILEPPAKKPKISAQAFIEGCVENTFRREAQTQPLFSLPSELLEKVILCLLPSPFFYEGQKPRFDHKAFQTLCSLRATSRYLRAFVDNMFMGIHHAKLTRFLCSSNLKTLYETARSRRPTILSSVHHLGFALEVCNAKRFDRFIAHVAHLNAQGDTNILQRIEKLSTRDSFIRDEHLGVFDHLRALEVYYCPHISSFSLAQNLQQLFVTGCDAVHHLEGLNILQKMCVRFCKNLERVSALPKLRELIVEGCQNLKDIHHLPMLEDLTLSTCPSVACLGDLQRLKKASIALCDGFHVIKSFPELLWLRINACDNFRVIAAQDMPRLKRLELLGLHNMTHITGLFKLHSLYVSHCADLQTVGHLTNLCVLKANNCACLTCVYDLPMLETLKAIGCSDLQFFYPLPHLKYLRLDFCPAIREISFLPSLEVLLINTLSATRRFRKMKNLWDDDDTRCEKFWGESGFRWEATEDLTALASLCAGRPALITHRGEKLAQICNLPQLKLLTVCYAPKLRMLGALPKLDFVLIKSCPNLRKLQDLPPISSVSVMCCRRKGLQDRLKKGSDVA